MKTPQAIFSALVAALALAAFVAFYDSYKPNTEMAQQCKTAEKTDNRGLPPTSIGHRPDSGSPRAAA